MTTEDQTPENLVARDDRVREYQFERLRTVGVARARDVQDRDGEPVSGGATSVIPVRVVGDDDRAAFVAGDRLIVPTERAERAADLVRRSVDIDQVERGQLVVKPVRGTRYTEVRATGLRLPSTLNDQLLGSEYEGRANHIVFAAYKFKVKEGEDPENGSVPAARAEDENLGEHAHVAILDTGYAWQARHDPWLGDIAPTVASRDIDLLRISGDPGEPLDFGAGHGTFVAGIVRQIAPKARIDIVRVLDSNGVGLESEIAKGFDRASALEPDVILCAFGGYSTDDVTPAAIETAVANVPKNTVVIAAAGNERQDARPIWPASCRGVEAIAALDSASDGSMSIAKGEAKLAWYSNFGPDVVYAAAGTWQSSFVNGDESPDRDPDGNPETFLDAATAGGTSFSAAAVAGAIAAAMEEGDTGVEAWDRIREHTYAVDCSELRAIDAWNRPER